MNKLILILNLFFILSSVSSEIILAKYEFKLNFGDTKFKFEKGMMDLTISSPNNTIEFGSTTSLESGSSLVYEKEITKYFYFDFNKIEKILLNWDSFGNSDGEDKKIYLKNLEIKETYKRKEPTSFKFDEPPKKVFCLSDPNKGIEPHNKTPLIPC